MDKDQHEERVNRAKIEPLDQIDFFNLGQSDKWDYPYAQAYDQTAAQAC